MDVQYARVHGCMWLFMGILTFGVAPLAVWWQRRRWPVKLDDDGMVLGTGAKVAWGAIRAVQRVAVVLDGQQVAERLDLDTDQGTVRLVTSNMLAADRVVPFVWAHIPPAARNAADGRKAAG